MNIAINCTINFCIFWDSTPIGYTDWLQEWQLKWIYNLRQTSYWVKQEQYLEHNNTLQNSLKFTVTPLANCTALHKQRDSVIVWDSYLYCAVIYRITMQYYFALLWPEDWVVHNQCYTWYSSLCSIFLYSDMITEVYWLMDHFLDCLLARRRSNANQTHFPCHMTLDWSGISQPMLRAFNEGVGYG